MSNKFVEHKGFNLVETNKEVLDKWMADDVFHKSIDERDGCPQFVFFEGPPSANGHPGIHHVLARAIKDTFNRYKTMQGFQVHRKAGWDTHGLPVELGVEKELGITKKDIDNKASEKYISTEDYTTTSILRLCGGSSSSSTTKACSTRATPFSRTRRAQVPDCRRTSSTSLVAIAT